MSLPYEFRVFVSYAREQRATVEHLLVELRTEGISAWWDRDIPPGNAWREILDEKIRHSRHLLLYWNIEAKASEMVNHEILTFLDDAKGDPSRTLFILLAPNCDKKHVPENLGEVQHVAAISEVVIHILKEERAELDGRLREAEYKSKRERDELEDLLGKERSKVAEARKYYEHRRFWGSFAENKDVHVFTCGRDIQPDATRPRGTSGFRTNIDKWDYRAVLAITHYFASHYPGTTLTIEDPESKLQQQDIQEPHALASRIAEVGTILHDKDCIIIGSPDVNDFAEIVLSRIHQIYPYDNKRKKSRGFVLIRNSKSTASAFYWQTATDEREGIARLGPSKHIYAYEPPDPAAGAKRNGRDAWHNGCGRQSLSQCRNEKACHDLVWIQRRRDSRNGKVSDRKGFFIFVLQI